MIRGTILTIFLAATLPAADPVKPIDFRLGDDLVTTLHFGENQPYLWPLNAPGGIAVTRAWPIDKTAPVSLDHPHHVSAWFAHGEVGGGDFWSVLPGHSRIVCVDAGQLKDNAVTTRNEWRLANGTVVMNEIRTIAVSAVAGGRLIVVTIDLTANGKPVTFGDTKEGGFSVRVSDKLCVGDKKIKNEKSRITNAAGQVGEKACWGYAADWCDYSGEVDGKPIGVAVFEDPTNKPRACWHVRDYGLMAANPFGRTKAGFPATRNRTDLVRLETGEHLKLRYGIFLHADDVAGGKVAEAYSQFLKEKK
jgi:hypothetical protein